METWKEGCIFRNVTYGIYHMSLPSMLPFMRRVLLFILHINNISVDVNGFWPLLVCIPADGV